MKLIGIIGGGECSEEIARMSEEVGEELARRGAVLICGGHGGVMEAVCRGAKREGGLTIGILLGTDPGEANPYIDIPIATGLGQARNLVIVNAAAALIAIDGEYGTLSELGFALKLGKRVIGLEAWEVPGVIVAKDPKEAVELALQGLEDERRPPRTSST